jgi:hypothetical protein
MRIARPFSSLYTNTATEDVAAAVVADSVVTVVVAEASRPVADAVVVTVAVEAVAVVDLATAVDEEVAVEHPVDVVRLAAAAVEEPVVERMLHLHSHALQAQSNKSTARSLSSPIATPVSLSPVARKISSSPRT